ncbi:ricin-type beta-trefoil lectin domain protein [Actinoplanes awajinensis]|uniref:Bulb-type lectin domain-containing protein n=1 Tax=Actinoplanes awajinensis subsp. mycoplanecinus TaxID=135947 RepID=A0A101JFG6_9ACTN|nr:ricin-type beta-trefoil lectin domain protein [Actinoplanes awajinensis]KUL25838.1 hypothetical protein ADL15_39720 [Actinoplanes awajinensis subsp. mycoplanecinus]
MTARRPRSFTQWLLVSGLAAATLIASVSTPAQAGAVSAGGTVLAAAAAASSAIYEQKLAVATKLGRGDDFGLIELADCDFVREIWNGLKTDPDKLEVRMVAEQAYLATPASVADQLCYQFIVTDVFAAFDRDAVRETREAAEKREQDLVRTAAAASIDIIADAALLAGSDADFARKIRDLLDTDTKWPKVKAAAVAAWNGSSEQQRLFITGGMAAAARQDTDDRIEADKTKTEAEKALERSRAAKQSAANRLGMPVTDELLNLPDLDFVVAVTKYTADGTEVQAAAFKASRSSDAAVWKSFIDSGLAEALNNDIKIAADRREAAYRRVAEEVKAGATASGFDNLFTAAVQGLAGDVDAVERFVNTGRFEVAIDDANRPTRGSWEWRNVHSDQCLGLKSGSTSDNSPLQQRGCSRADDQLWIGMRVYGTGGRYRLISAKDRTKCVSLADSTDKNSAFVVRTCDGKPDQYFYYKKIKDNFIWISEQVNRAITIQGASRDAGAPAVVADVTDANNQQFFGTSDRLTSGQRLEEARILHTQTGITLNLQPDGNLVIYKGPRAIWASNTTNGARFVNQTDGNLVIYRADNASVWASNTSGNGPSTLWLQDDGNLVLYRNKDSKAIWSTNVFDVPIASTLSGKCIDVNGSTFEAGTRLQTWTCNSSSAQKWIALGETLLSLNNKCAEVAGGSKANGAVLQLGTCNGSGGQRFVFNANGNLVNPQSGRCVDIPNADRGDGIQLQIRDCVTAAVSQKWRRL